MMSIAEVLNGVIAVLKRMHVLGDEAEALGRIICILQGLADAASEAQKEERDDAE